MGAGERVIGLVETGRVPKLRRIEDAETGFTKFTLEHTEGEPPTLLLWAGLGEQADHAWQALELVALAFAPAGEPVKALVEQWRREADAPPPECRDPALCLRVRRCAEGCNGEPPIGSGAGVAEPELREAVGWIVDRSPTWDERNMLAVQRFNRAIAELVRLRAIEAAARDVAKYDFGVWDFILAGLREIVEAE